MCGECNVCRNVQNILASKLQRDVNVVCFRVYFRCRNAQHVTLLRNVIIYFFEYSLDTFIFNNVFQNTRIARPFVLTRRRKRF